MTDEQTPTTLLTLDALVRKLTPAELARLKAEAVRVREQLAALRAAIKQQEER